MDFDYISSRESFNLNYLSSHHIISLQQQNEFLKIDVCESGLKLRSVLLALKPVILVFHFFLFEILCCSF